MKNVSNYLENFNNQKLYSMFKTKILWGENGAENIPSYKSAHGKKLNFFDWLEDIWVCLPPELYCHTCTMYIVQLSLYYILLYLSLFLMYFFNNFLIKQNVQKSKIYYRSKWLAYCAFLLMIIYRFMYSKNFVSLRL